MKVKNEGRGSTFATTIQNQYEVLTSVIEQKDFM